MLIAKSRRMLPTLTSIVILDQRRGSGQARIAFCHFDVQFGDPCIRRLGGELTLECFAFSEIRSVVRIAHDVHPPTGL